MIYLKFAMMPLIGAVIGWLTNMLAIKLIFRPVKPVKIPLLKIYVQGILPKRRAEIAKSIGDIIDSELISKKDILNSILENGSIDSVKEELKKKIRVLIEAKLNNVLFMAFKETAISFIEKMIDENGEEMLKDFLNKAVCEIPHKIDFSKMIEDKINTFEMEYFEKIIISVAKKELRHIERLGAVLGFIIGVVQGVIIIFA